MFKYASCCLKHAISFFFIIISVLMYACVNLCMFCVSSFPFIKRRWFLSNRSLLIFFRTSQNCALNVRKSESNVHICIKLVSNERKNDKKIIHRFQSELCSCYHIYFIRFQNWMVSSSATSKIELK